MHSIHKLTHYPEPDGITPEQLLEYRSKLSIVGVDQSVVPVESGEQNQNSTSGVNFDPLGSWAAFRACVGMDPNLFFPDSPLIIKRREAMKTCGQCAVQPECLEYALSQGPSLHGIWGGTTHSQRNKLRKKLREQAKQNGS